MDGEDLLPPDLTCPAAAVPSAQWSSRLGEGPGGTLRPSAGRRSPPLAGTRRGHGQANERIPDDAIVEFAALSGRAVLRLNRWEFIGLHARLRRHPGIVVCTQDPNVERQAAAIDAARYVVSKSRTTRSRTASSAGGRVITVPSLDGRTRPDLSCHSSRVASPTWEPRRLSSKREPADATCASAT